MNDYYEPHARFRLARHVVLAGQIGSATPAIGRNVSSQTGLPFIEVDRLIEHESGRALARLAVEQGGAALARAADSMLDRVSRQTPFGLIVLDRVWPAARGCTLIRSRMDLVHVCRPVQWLLERLPEEVRRAGDWILAGASIPSSEDQVLHDLLARRAPLLREAGIVLDAGGLHAHQVAAVLIESLEQLLSDESR